jgi:MFS family permease
MSKPTAVGEFRRHWSALAAATIGIALGVGVLPTYVNGLAIPELEAEFGWSRTALSTLPLIGSLIITVTAPVVGIIVDRYGVRVPAVISLLAFSAGYFVLSVSGSSFGRYVLVFALMYLLAAASTAVAFTRTLNERYDRARGLALGIALSGAGVVGFVVPAVIGPMIADSWRAGYRVLAVTVLVCAFVVFFLMPRRRSGVVVARQARGRRVPVRHVLRQRLFWQLAIAFLALALAVGGMLQHLFPMLRDAGVSAASAAGITSIVGVAVIVSRLLVGLLVDRFFAPRIAALALLVSVAGYVALLVGGSTFAWFAAIGIGLASGAEVDIIGNLTSRYYALENYGRIFGIFYAVFFLGFGMSPLLMAYARSLAGGYTLPVAVSVGLLAVAAILLFAAPPFPAGADAGDEAHQVARSRPVA